MPIACRVITAEQTLVDGSIAYASIPAWDGLLGVLPGHAPLVARLGMGELRIDFAGESEGAGSRGGSRTVLVDGGFVQVVNDKLTILAEQAWPAESINQADAEAELRELEARRVPEGADAADERSALERQRQRARAKVRLAAKSRGKGI